MFNRPTNLDELNKCLLLTGLIAAVAGMFFAYGTAVRYALTAVMAAAIVFAAIRMFSKNTARRYQENLQYLRLTTGIRTFFRNTFKTKPGNAARANPAGTHRAKRARKNPTWSEIKQYKYFVCPQCAQRLRVPRGKGKLRVTCTRCGNIFETKS